MSLQYIMINDMQEPEEERRGGQVQVREVHGMALQKCFKSRIEPGCQAAFRKERLTDQIADNALTLVWGGRTEVGGAVIFLSVIWTSQARRRDGLI